VGRERITKQSTGFSLQLTADVEPVSTPFAINGTERLRSATGKGWEWGVQFVSVSLGQFCSATRLHPTPRSVDLIARTAWSNIGRGS
jgi:hypothetical protein